MFSHLNPTFSLKHIFKFMFPIKPLMTKLIAQISLPYFFTSSALTCLVCTSKLSWSCRLSTCVTEISSDSSTRTDLPASCPSPVISSTCWALNTSRMNHYMLKTVKDKMKITLKLLWQKVN